ncbi:MAG: host attachment family protein [Candidatus Uhrbacteria bacterium]|nr:host attachment family protein [Candidatus Uhrbacteria bacterium]
MHIPEPLHAYEKATLLVVCDNEHARFFSLQGRELTESGEVRVEHASKDGNDRTSGVTSGGGHFAEMNEKMEDQSEKRFAKLLAQELHRRLQAKEFEDLILTVPEPRINEFVDGLHNDVRARLVMTLGKTLSKEPITEVLKRIQKPARSS